MSVRPLNDIDSLRVSEFSRFGTAVLLLIVNGKLAFKPHANSNVNSGGEGLFHLELNPTIVLDIRKSNLKNLIDTSEICAI
jgi:hypothetical protein